MERFNEFSERAAFVMEDFQDLLTTLTMRYEVHFKDPHHDVARRFLNEIMEFKPLEEEKRSSLKPWEKG